MSPRRIHPASILFGVTAMVWSCAIYDNGLLSSGPVVVAGAAGTSTAGAMASAGSAAGGTAAGTGGASATGGANATSGVSGLGNGAGAGGGGGVGGADGLGGEAGAALPSCFAPDIIGIALNAPHVLEAEDAELAGGTVATVGGNNVSGTGYADMLGKEGSMTWFVEVQVGGDYTLTWKYAQLDSRDMTLEVNCVVAFQSVPFEYTGDWYTTWKTDISRVVRLNLGTNQLVLSTNGESGPNFDTMTISAN